jgi:uncharacterized protein (TIGR02145 family)
MKRSIFFILFCLMWLNMVAQVPQAFKYQAVARDANGNVLDKKPVSFKISILKTSTTGSVVYSETHSKTTNSFGLVDLEIGKGDSPTGSFSGINWGNDTYFIKVEMDPAGGTVYQTMGTSQLLSVPYALHAKSSSNYDETDPFFSLSPAKTISNSSILNWNTAFGWGNHSGLYKLNSYLPAWSEITGKPSFATLAATGNFSDLTGKPTTLSGYGITDAVTITGDQTITGIKTFSKDLLVNWLTVGMGKGAVSSNTAVGYQALYSNTTGSANTANGYNALYSNTIGRENTADGFQALYYNTTGMWSTANGYKSLYFNTEGNSNTANGLEALYSNTKGEGNTSNGVNSLHSNTIGNNNTASGANALYYNTTGYSNTANGYGAGYSNTSGNYNVFLGFQAGYYETGSNKLFIDNQPRTSELVAREKALIYGVFDADPVNQVLTINGSVNVNSNKIINLADPVSSKDAVNKAYVDALFNQLKSAAITISDVDRNCYPVVQIDTQFWMGANLRTTKYNDGTDIPLVTSRSEWMNLTTPGYCSYKFELVPYVTYEVLYNWYTVNTGKLCPKGWHVPSDAEWKTLTDYLGGEDVAGGKMKSVTGWETPNTGATNESGFSGLPGGGRILDGYFLNIGNFGGWWSSTEASAAHAWYRGLGNDYAGVSRYYYFKDYGFSVRCVRD